MMASNNYENSTSMLTGCLFVKAFDQNCLEAYVEEEFSMTIYSYHGYRLSDSFTSKRDPEF